MLLISGAVCDFQSRLRKKAQVNSFTLSGLKNRKEKKPAVLQLKDRPICRERWDPRAREQPPAPVSPLFGNFQRK